MKTLPWQLNEINKFKLNLKLLELKPRSIYEIYIEIKNK